MVGLGERRTAALPPAKGALLVVVAAAIVAPDAAWACTLCHSRTAEAVRAAVLGAGMWTNAVTLLAPIPLLAAAILLVRRMSP